MVLRDRVSRYTGPTNAVQWAPAFAWSSGQLVLAKREDARVYSHTTTAMHEKSNSQSLLPLCVCETTTQQVASTPFSVLVQRVPSTANAKSNGLRAKNSPFLDRLELLRKGS